MIHLYPAGLEVFFKEEGVPMPDQRALIPPPTEEHIARFKVRAPQFGIVLHVASA